MSKFVPRSERKKTEGAFRSVCAELGALAANKPYMIALLITSIASYGYSVAHNSISIDDFTSDIYYPLDGEMVAQGRFTIVLFANIFRMLKNVPYFCDVLSVICFGLAAMLMCVFLDRAAGGKLSLGAKIVFSCVLVSYPGINEIFVYGGGNFNVCFGYLMTAAALLLFRHWYDMRKKSSLIWLFVDLFFVISLYESFAVVFLCGVVALFLMHFYYAPKDADRGRFGKVLVLGLVAIGVLAAAIAVEFAAGKIVLAALDLKASENAATDIAWFDPESSPAEALVLLITDFALYFYVAAPHYLPLLLLEIFLVLDLIIGVAAWIKNKNFTVAALFFALAILQFALTFVSGRVAPMRTAQYYAVFIAFLSALIFERANVWVKTDAKKDGKFKKFKENVLRRALPAVSALLAFWLIFVQAYDLNNWLFLDVLRSEEEIATARAIGDELQKDYDTKNHPVVFVGRYEISDFITEQCSLPLDDPRKENAVSFFRSLANKDLPGAGAFRQVAENVDTYLEAETGRFKFVRSNLGSYLYWATLAFETPNGELMKLYRYLGYDFHSVDSYELVNAYRLPATLMPSYPEEGYISMDEEGVIIVKLGNSAVDYVRDR